MGCVELKELDLQRGGVKVISTSRSVDSVNLYCGVIRFQRLSRGNWFVAGKLRPQHSLMRV